MLKDHVIKIHQTSVTTAQGKLTYPHKGWIPIHLFSAQTVARKGDNIITAATTTAPMWGFGRTLPWAPSQHCRAIGWHDTNTCAQRFGTHVSSILQYHLQNWRVVRQLPISVGSKDLKRTWASAQLIDGTGYITTSFYSLFYIFELHIRNKGLMVSLCALTVKATFHPAPSPSQGTVSPLADLWWVAPRLEHGHASRWCPWPKRARVMKQQSEHLSIIPQKERF